MQGNCKVTVPIYQHLGASTMNEIRGIGISEYVFDTAEKHKKLAVMVTVT